jgi:hypothetical protein
MARPRLYTIPELARACRISETAVRSRIRRRGLTPATIDEGEARYTTAQRDMISTELARGNPQKSVLDRRTMLRHTSEQMETWTEQAHREGHEDWSAWARKKLDAACVDASKEDE